MERSQGFKGAVRNLRGIGKGATGVLAQQGVRDQVPGACNIACEEGVPKTLGMIIPMISTGLVNLAKVYFNQMTMFYSLKVQPLNSVL